MDAGWGAKSAALLRISRTVGTERLAFVDRDPAERAEVASVLPSVRCYPAESVRGFPALAEFRAGTALLPRRRRPAAEPGNTGPSAAFLLSLELRLTVRSAGEHDRDAVGELTRRGHRPGTTAAAAADRGPRRASVRCQWMLTAFPGGHRCRRTERSGVVT